MGDPSVRRGEPSPAGAQPVVVCPGLQVLRVRDQVTDLAPVPNDRHTVLVNVGRPYRLVETLDGRTQETRGAPGDVAVVPVGASLAVRSRDGTPQRVDSVAVLLVPALLEEAVAAAGAGPSAAELVPGLAMRSPQVSQLATLLLQALPDETGLGRVAAESLGRALAVAVLREHSAGRPAAAPRLHAGLSTAQLEHVLAHVEDRLSAPLTLAELAAVAHVSPFHFARLFRASTGRSPHEYVVERRVARARELLLGTTLPLAEVATRCGFADQSHLTRSTRRHLGGTPAALRAAASVR